MKPTKNPASRPGLEAPRERRMEGVQEARALTRLARRETLREAVFL